MALILGIDPGSRVTGFGLLKVDMSSGQVRHLSHGVIVLPEAKPLWQRLSVLSENLQSLFEKYRPGIVAVEKIFLGKNADSAFKLGHARGVVLAVAAAQKAEVFEYATRVVKKGVTGRGSASKEEVAFLVQRLLSLKKIETLDASDALALALHHAGLCQVLHRRRSREVQL
jgi:crossover junction endodeoxyribonuclease RuvC